jgi:hypothetical protein
LSKDIKMEGPVLDRALETLTLELKEAVDGNKREASCCATRADEEEVEPS